MIKYTTSNLKKLEALFKELGYSVRHGKGNFKSGYCLLENKKVVVLNKFNTTESMMGALLDILSKMDVEEDKLSEASLKFLALISKEKTKS